MNIHKTIPCLDLKPNLYHGKDQYNSIFFILSNYHYKYFFIYFLCHFFIILLNMIYSSYLDCQVHLWELDCGYNTLKV